MQDEEDEEASEAEEESMEDEQHSAPLQQRQVILTTIRVQPSQPIRENDDESDEDWAEGDESQP
jgi:hypothetical protein